MTTHPPTPIGPIGEEPLSGLFSEILNLADQVSSRITEDEVETRLRRVMRRDGQRGPASADCTSRTVPWDSITAVSALRRGPSRAAPTVDIQSGELLQAVAKARSELAAVGAEMRQTLEQVKTVYTEAEKARADAMTAYADAAKSMSEAQAHNAAALGEIASVVREAKLAAEDIRQAYTNAAEDIRQAYTNAAKVMSEAHAYHDATQGEIATAIREAKLAAEDIRQAAREAADWRSSNRSGRQTSKLVHAMADDSRVVLWVRGAEWAERTPLTVGMNAALDVFPSPPMVASPPGIDISDFNRRCIRAVRSPILDLWYREQGTVQGTYSGTLNFPVRASQGVTWWQTLSGSTDAADVPGDRFRAHVSRSTGDYAVLANGGAIVAMWDVGGGVLEDVQKVPQADADGQVQGDETAPQRMQ